MLKEIYCRQRNDPKADHSILEHSSVYETILGKIRMILVTQKGEILGDPDFGASLETYIFETNFDAREIEDEIKRQISQYIKEASRYDISVKLDLQKGANHDVGILSIKIDGEDAFGVMVS